MMRSSLIVAAAVLIGFVAVLVYRVSASDAMGLGQLPTPMASISPAPAAAHPLAVEFIVQQCDIAIPDAILAPTTPETGRVPQPASTGVASLTPSDPWVIVDGVPQFVLEDDRLVAEAETGVPSPSIHYIQ